MKAWADDEARLMGQIFNL